MHLTKHLPQSTAEKYVIGIQTGAALQSVYTSFSGVTYFGQIKICKHADERTLGPGTRRTATALPKGT